MFIWWVRERRSKRCQLNVILDPDDFKSITDCVFVFSLKWNNDIMPVGKYAYVVGIERRNSFFARQ